VRLPPLVCVVFTYHVHWSVGGRRGVGCVGACGWHFFGGKWQAWAWGSQCVRCVGLGLCFWAFLVCDHPAAALSPSCAPSAAKTMVDRLNEVADKDRERKLVASVSGNACGGRGVRVVLWPSLGIVFFLGAARFFFHLPAVELLRGSADNATHRRHLSSMPPPPRAPAT
jgi:hypothetical protein